MQYKITIAISKSVIARVSTKQILSATQFSTNFDIHVYYDVVNQIIGSVG